MKESNPIEVAEFAVSREIDDESAFCWWVPYTLHKHDRPISAVNARGKCATQKYGAEVPRNYTEAKMLNDRNNNTLWKDVGNKEMENLMVAVDILEESESMTPGWNKTSSHLVFDVCTTLERKAQ